MIFEISLDIWNFTWSEYLCEKSICGSLLSRAVFISVYSSLFHATNLHSKPYSIIYVNFEKNILELIKLDDKLLTLGSEPRSVAV